MQNKLYIIIVSIFWLSCGPTNKSVREATLPKFDTEAHRGGRGLMPENTIPAMLKAIDLGVTTLEMDLQITKDKKVIVSHDPNFNTDITTTPDGKYLTKEDAKKLMLYGLSYDEIKKYDVGLKPHPGFPRQQKLAAIKPLLADLISETASYSHKKNVSLFYNIEIKSNAKNYGKNHPPVEEFVDLAMAVINSGGIAGRTIIQSFDPRALIVMHRKYPKVKTALLIEQKDKRSIREQLDEIGFTPTIYSPNYHLVTPELVRECHNLKMKVLPWTPNTLEELRRLKDMGVDGIITDYPDLFSQL